MKSANLLILLACISISFNANSAERITTSKIQDMFDFVVKKKAEVGAESILVIYDFDNTLMAMNQDSGSDQWYYWQQSALKSEDKKLQKEAWVKSSSELYRLHYKLFALGAMHLVEPNTAQVVRDIQNMKIKSIVLTARGTVYKNDIEIELGKEKIDFKDSAIGPVGGYASTFKFEQLENPREVSYQDGVVLGSGQNKGQILKALLLKTNTQFKTIVFIDDTLKNIENMEAEYKDNAGVTVFHYTHEEPRVKKFEKDKSKVLKEWKQLKPILKFYQDDDKKL